MYQPTISSIHNSIYVIQFHNIFLVDRYCQAILSKGHWISHDRPEKYT